MDPPLEAELPSAATLEALLQATPDGTLPWLPEGDPALVEPGQNKRDIIAQWSDTPAGAAVVPLRDGGVERSRWGGQRVGCCCSTELSYDAFVSDYMAPNKPVLIKGVAQNWAASREWVDGQGGVAMGLLAERHGGATVSVTTMPDGDPSVDASWQCEEMTLAAYADWWRRWRAGDPSAGRSPKYLKDWHFANEFGGQFRAYRLPKFFREDWLNAFYDSVASESSTEIVASDYRFVYCGPRGSWTPVHADVLRSFSWSANVAGRKRWLLLPPEQTYRLYDASGTRLASSMRPEDLRDSAARFPLLQSAATHISEVIQMPGDALFVPSGWHHMVENLDDCLSINHNWFNQYNIHWTLAFVQHGYAEAVAAIEDCRELCDTVEEFEGLVQRNLFANCGLDGAQLLHLLLCAAATNTIDDAADDTAVHPSSQSTIRLAKELCMGRIRGCLAALCSDGERIEANGSECNLAASIDLLPASRKLRESLAEHCGRQMEG